MNFQKSLLKYARHLQIVIIYSKAKRFTGKPMLLGTTKSNIGMEPSEMSTYILQIDFSSRKVGHPKVYVARELYTLRIDTI